MKQRTTTSRKRDHVELTVRKEVGFRSKSAGFEEWELKHNALPELDLSDLDTGVPFLGRRLAFPLMVSCMTGGYPEAEKINRTLAEACEEFRLAMGVGSQRQALEDSRYHRSFSVVRGAAPHIPIVGNIGAPEIAAMKDLSPVHRLAEMIGADAFAVHLNPLQEFLQPEGNTHFRGVLTAIEHLVKELPIPVIVKEIGAGISAPVARRLIDAGVRIIDVAGAGGTSWAGVEILRKGKNERPLWEAFWDWGIRTTDALNEVVPLKKENPGLTVIGSGGIMSGLDAAKAVALGADLAASARPMMKAVMTGGEKGIHALLAQWKLEFAGAMFLTGMPDVPALRNARPIERRQ